MSALTDLLERLRRMRPPPGGPATVVAVPSAAEAIAGEVAFLFADLDAIEAQLGELDESVRAEAAAIEANARTQRDRILAEGREHAERAWSELLAERRVACEQEVETILAEGRRAAERVLTRGRASMPALVAEVVRRIEDPGC